MPMFYNSFGKDIYDISNENAANRIGGRIRNIRVAKGLSQAELGAKVGLTADRIQKYENGARKPKIDLLRKIADALSVNILALVDPTTSSYIHIMYALFELENKFGVKLEKDDHKICLTVDFRESLYQYLNGWYEEYSTTMEELEVASTEEEKQEIMASYYDWEWNYPDGIVNEKTRGLRRARIKRTIAKLQEELKSLEDTVEDINM